MVNQTVYDYLKKYRDRYPLEALKEKSISSGYAPDEVEEAMNKLKEEDLAENTHESDSPIETKSDDGLSREQEVSPLQENEGSNLNEDQEKLRNFFQVGEDFNPNTSEPVSNSNIFLLTLGGVGGIFGVIMFILLAVSVYLLGPVVLTKPIPLIIILSFLSFISFITFFYSASTLGEIYSKKFLKIISLICTFFVILLIFFQVFLFLFPPKISAAENPTFTEFDFNTLFSPGMFIYSILFIFIISVFAILNLLWGVALTHIQIQVGFAKFCGRFHAVSSLLIFFGLGIVLLPFSYVLCSILFFKAKKEIKMILGESDVLSR